MNGKRVPPGLDSEALLGKSKFYVRKALLRKDSNDLDEYQLWASLALELLGKASLATIHPCLIADPQHSDSLFAASGIQITTDIKTISAHTLFERLRRIVPKFDEKAKDFCTNIALRRNAELHSGETPFRSMRLEAWEAQYWHASHTILDGMGSSLDDWLGASQAEVPREIVKHVTEAKQQAVQIRVERAKDGFLARKKAEREKILAESNFKKYYHYKDLFTMFCDEHWEYECPSCNGKAFLTGNKIGEEILDQYDDTDSAWEIVSKDYLAEQFHCPVCDLLLDGSEEIEAAGIDLSHSVKEEREMEYEPDYGND